MKITLKSIKHRWYAEWKPWVLECWRLMMKILKFVKYFWADADHRRCSLVGAGILGVVLAYIVSCLTNIFGLDNKTLQSSITIFALGLPIFYVLWVFRTYDVQRQIDKVQKQIDKTEEDTNNSTFFECARMLAEGEPIPEDVKDYNLIKHKSLPTKTALEQLAYLKEETGFDKKRIDSLTRGLNLIKKIFNLARFSGLDLSKAILNEAELNEADLTGAELNEADLTGAELNEADLANAELNDANLANAELNDANLANVKLNGADLTRAELNDAKLNGADLIGANLRGANLTFANLSKAKLNKAILIDAKLIEVDLIGANLRGANLTRAELIFANLSDVDLTRADLNDAKLYRAKLIKADLRGAKLYRAKLIKADLRGAKLSRADLNDADLTGAIYDSKTKFISTILESQEMRDKAGIIYRENEPA